MKNETHKKVTAFLGVLRGGYPDAAIIYGWGACYGLYLLLKHLYANAEAYFDDSDKSHIITKIEGRFYDISGEVDEGSYGKFQPKVLTIREKEIWSAKSSGQRVEYMLSKYHRAVKRRSEDK